MKNLKNGKMLAAKCGLAAMAIIAQSAFGQAVSEPADRTVSVFLKPMMILASVGTGITDAGALLALRTVNLQPPLGREEAEARYQEGLELVRAHDRRAALVAFQDAAENGHGMAQRKLGDLYGTGYEDVDRDYEISLRWYQSARNQGVDIPNKPFVYRFVGWR